MTQNDVTTATAGTGFIPEIWANEALEILRANIVATRLVAKDTDLATFQVGDKLHIPYPGTMVAHDKATNTPVTLQTPTSTDYTVTLDKHKEASFLIEDFTRAQANPVIMQSYIEAQMVALAEQVETDVVATYSSFSTSVGTAGTDLSAATLRTIAKTFTDKKVSKNQRHLLISTKDVVALQADSSLETFFAYNDNRDHTVTTGELPEIYGLQLHESQLVPVVAGTPDTTNNLAFAPRGIILASRRLPDAPLGTGVAQHSIQDPESGLVLRVTMGYDHSQLGVQVTMDILYGVSKLRDEMGIVALS